MKGQADRFRKILNAQKMMEQGAKAKVAQLQMRQLEVEQKFEEAKTAAENSVFMATFSDLYIRHLHQLTSEQVTINDLIQNARHQHQIEKKRSEVIEDKLKKQRRFDEDRAENENLLELVIRTPMKK